MRLTPEENRELKRLLLKAAGWDADPDSQADPVIRTSSGAEPLPEGATIIVLPAAQPQHGSAKVHGDKIDTDN
jgi:hypothetical protein